MARVLVVDDDLGVRQLLGEALVHEGYEVLEANDGNAGAKVFRAAPADVIIMDIFMPGKSGLEAIAELRREFPGVKVIAVTAAEKVGEFDPLSRARELGAARTLTKPFDMDALLEVVKELVES